MKQNHVSDLDSHWSIHRHVALFLKWEGGRLILNKIMTSKKKVRGWKDIFLNPFPLAKSDADQKTLASKDVRKILFVVGRGVGATSIPLASTFHCLFTCFQIDFLHGAIKIGRGQLHVNSIFVWKFKKKICCAKRGGAGGLLPPPFCAPNPRCYVTDPSQTTRFLNIENINYQWY